MITIPLDPLLTRLLSRSLSFSLSHSLSLLMISRVLGNQYFIQGLSSIGAIISYSINRDGIVGYVRATYVNMYPSDDEDEKYVAHPLGLDSQ